MSQDKGQEVWVAQFVRDEIEYSKGNVQPHVIGVYSHPRILEMELGPEWAPESPARTCWFRGDACVWVERFCIDKLTLVPFSFLCGAPRSAKSL